jgi:hypothetical protein
LLPDIFRQCVKQYLRLGDREKFRRRRKALKRGRKHGVGVGGAAS